MSRFILYQDKQQTPSINTEEVIRHVGALPDAKIVNTTSKALLVDGPEEQLKRIVETMPGWSIAPEQTYDVPKPHPGF